MIVQKEFINKLKDFGLNSYESKLWVALLSRGVSTAGELSDISNVPRSRAYDVLESLEKKGFIIVKVGKPIKYLAVPPTEVVERVKKKVVEEAERKNTVLTNLKQSDLLEELSTLHTEGVKLVDPTDKSGAFRGRAKVHEHLSTIIKNAKKNITIMTSKKGFERKYSALSAPLKKAAKAGIKIRVAAHTADKKTLELFEKIAEVKQNKEFTTRFCMVDDSQLLLFLTNDDNVHKSYDCAVWIEAPYFVSHYSKMFENEWKK